MAPAQRGLVLAAVAGLALAAGWWSLRRDTGPELDRGAASASSDPAHRGASAVGGEGGAGAPDAAVNGTDRARGMGGGAAGEGDADVHGTTQVGAGVSLPTAQLPPSTRPFASPEEASAFVEGKVLDLFATVTPELDRAQVSKSCTADGRECTFEGPWPGDDFMKRWVRAISEGRTGPEAMDGVKFSTFKPVGGVEDRRFVLVARAP